MFNEIIGIIDMIDFVTCHKETEYDHLCLIIHVSLRSGCCNILRDVDME